MPKIGDILVQRGWITPEQLEEAHKESQRTGEIIGKTLVRMGLISEEQLLSALGEQLGLPFYPDLSKVSISPEAVKAVPARFIWHYKFMPLKLEKNVLTIAIPDPLAVWPMEDIKLHLGYEVERVLTTQEQILSAIRKYYGLGAETVEEILERDKEAGEAVKKERVGEVEDLEKQASDASVIKLVNEILSEAISSSATDIHFEAYRDRVRVRYRIDGILYNVRLPSDIKYLYPAIVSRIKILSNLDIIERRLPQDGRAIVRIKDKQVDLRISVIPSLYGENVVIRILPIKLLYNLEDIGFFPEELQIIESLLNRPHGIVFLTGPTGSGKTTTLYAFLNRLNKEGVKIITIEDPVEYELLGIFQIQVKPEIGFNFANALRSILRHDPDIMMIGEVRDLETAELAIRTALTGHLIFSTLHTNDACSGVTRLVDIGIEPYLVASSVNAFISQRLVRKICPFCKEEVRDRKSIYTQDLEGVKLFKGRGCKECKSTGYKGRTAIYEILLINDKIRDLILKKASSTQIKNVAKTEGFKTLKESGIQKATMGITTIEEVMRVTELEG
jgi:type II secretory ATPase GspE/PulE/Tfp pilus assembly ATPase PilB-like protein